MAEASNLHLIPAKRNQEHNKHIHIAMFFNKSSQPQYCCLQMGRQFQKLQLYCIWSMSPKFIRTSTVWKKACARAWGLVCTWAEEPRGAPFLPSLPVCNKEVEAEIYYGFIQAKGAWGLRLAAISPTSTTKTPGPNSKCLRASEVCTE